VPSPLEPVPGAAQPKPNVRKTLDATSLREALAAHLDGASVRLRGAMWLVSSAPV
jgi:hypothetical protein